MLEAIYSPGETLFFANGGIIENHTCMGSFENEGKMNYVITPYGKVNTIPDEKTFKTFTDAKQFIVDAAEKIAKDAQAQAERIRDFAEGDVTVLPNTAPTQAEVKADEAK